MTDSNTRAAVPTPKRKKNDFLPKAPAPVQPADNMRGERLAPMTFNMPKSWHTEFKIDAARRGMNMKELLMLSYEALKREESGKS
jgi:hypothetical protein